MNAAWLILASASPRRLALLQAAGLEPRVVVADVDERRGAGDSPVGLARRLARDKASSDHVLREAERANAGSVAVWSLGADTVVHRDGRVFEKPVDAEEAESTLATLSGGWHEVTTGFCVQTFGGGSVGLAHVEHVTTRVLFRSLSAAEIGRYVRTGEPLDKAGAYGIQGIGGALVAQIQGSYTNVVGLPLESVLSALDQAGAPVERSF